MNGYRNRSRSRLSGLARTLLASLALSLFATPSAARFYKYVDRNGTTVFVDDESRIPPEYRQDLKTYREELDDLSPEERTAVQERERLEREREQSQRQEDRRRQQEEAARKAYAEALETRVTVRGNQVLVPVQVSHRGGRASLDLLLDTGATNTVFHRDALEGIDLGEGEKALGQGVGGFVFTTELIRFGQIRVGPFEANNAPAFVIDNRDSGSGIDGLLGMDFLKSRGYKIDYEKQVIRWDP